MIDRQMRGGWCGENALQENAHVYAASGKDLMAVLAWEGKTSLSSFSLILSEV
jgi:hypothetical protein